MSRTESSEFWRRGLWVRPALWVLASLCTAATAVLFLGEAYDVTKANRALEADRYCETSGESSCVETEVGYLKGPDDQWRSSNDGWQLHRDGRFIASFDVSRSASRDLAKRGDAAVWALVYQGEVVAVESAEGDRVPTVLGGTGALVFALCAAAAATGLALVLLVVGVANTPLADRLPGGQRLLGVALALGACLAAPAFFWILPMSRGLEWRWGALFAAFAGVTAIGFSVETLRDTSRGDSRPWYGGRHARNGL